MQCPVCKAALEQDFGVIACTECQSVLFVDMDGNIQVSEAANHEIQSEVQDDFNSEPHSNSESQSDLQLEPLFQPETEVEPLLKVENLSDVVEFANSEKSNLTYTVTIENIDTKEIREDLIQILLDPKFQWDIREIKKKIEKGRLNLENLNPAKASVLVNKVRCLHVKIKWKQNVY